MFNFNEEAVRKEHENGVGIIAKTQEVVDQICKEGFKNIFYIGIGGTILYAGQMEHIVKEAGSTIPLILENAADFNWVGILILEKILLLPLHLSPEIQKK